MVRLICKRQVDLLGRIVLPIQQTLGKNHAKELLFLVTPDSDNKSIKIKLEDQGLSASRSLVKTDEVNQLLIPSDVRMACGVETYTEFNISFDDVTETYILEKVIPACVICGETKNIMRVFDKDVRNGYLCEACLNHVGEFLKKRK